MVKAFSLLPAGLTAALALAGSVQAHASAYDRFDAAAAASPTERLVLCDTTAFLANRPDLNADRIVLHRLDRIPVVLLPPQFVSGGFLYSERYERVFNRLRAKHEASVRDVAQVQAGPGRAMVDLYRGSHWIDQGFVARQDRYCRGFAAGYGVRGGF
jgi:hypothetical protein